MNKAKDYREYARECRMIARGSRKEQERAQLEQMAQTWEALATERERMLRNGAERKENNSANK